MRDTSACADCLVSFVLRDDPSEVDPADESAVPAPHDESLVLQPAEALAVGRLARAGLVPALRHEAAVP